MEIKDMHRFHYFYFYELNEVWMVFYENSHLPKTMLLCINENVFFLDKFVF